MSLSLSLLISLLLCVFPTSLASSPEACALYRTGHACLSVNDNAHPLPELANIQCVWCQRTDKDVKVSHCTTLDVVRENTKYHTDWVCDYSEPQYNRPVPRPRFTAITPVTIEDPYSGGGGGKGKGGKGGMGKGTGMGNGGGPLENLINDLKKKAPKPLQFLGGLAVGVLGHLAGINPSKVVMGIDQVTGDLTNLFNGFKLTPDGLKNTASNVANTIRDMSSVLNDAGLHDLANKASKVADIASKAEGWIVKAQQIAYKGVNIYHDLQQAAKDFKAGKYYEVGNDIGNIINAIHPKSPASPTLPPHVTPPHTALPKPATGSHTALPHPATGKMATGVHTGAHATTGAGTAKMGPKTGTGATGKMQPKTGSTAKPKPSTTGVGGH